MIYTGQNWCFYQTVLWLLSSLCQPIGKDFQEVPGIQRDRKNWLLYQANHSNHLTACLPQSDGKHIHIIRIILQASTAERLGLPIFQVVFKIFSLAKGYS